MKRAEIKEKEGSLHKGCQSIMLPNKPLASFHRAALHWTEVARATSTPFTVSRYSRPGERPDCIHDFSAADTYLEELTAGGILLVVVSVAKQQGLS
jgi:hypothetical protein